MLGCERHLCRPGAVLIKGASSPLHQPRLPVAVSTLCLTSFGLQRFSSAVKQVPQYSYKEAWPTSPDHGGLFESVQSSFMGSTHTCSSNQSLLSQKTHCQIADSFHLQQLSLPDQCWTLAPFSHQHDSACCKLRSTPSQAATLKGSYEHHVAFGKNDQTSYHKLR